MKIHNNGKEKFQSFEAWYPQLENIIQKGYGKDEKEAINNHLILIGDMIDYLNDNLKEPTKIEYVDWKGEKI